MTPAEILGLDADELEPGAIKRAYAAQLKLHRPDQDPEGFRRVREAYQVLLRRIEARSASAVTITVLEPPMPPTSPVTDMPIPSVDVDRANPPEVAEGDEAPEPESVGIDLEDEDLVVRLAEAYAEDLRWGDGAALASRWLDSPGAGAHGEAALALARSLAHADSELAARCAAIAYAALPPSRRLIVGALDRDLHIGKEMGAFPVAARYAIADALASGRWTRPLQRAACTQLVARLPPKSALRSELRRRRIHGAPRWILPSPEQRRRLPTSVRILLRILWVLCWVIPPLRPIGAALLVLALLLWVATWFIGLIRRRRNR